MAGKRMLVSQPPVRQPTSADIRRAISTAYYAAFHALTTSNADALIGPAHDPLAIDTWIRIYRGLSHKYAKAQLQNNRSSLPVDAQIFADLFRDLQNERHNADYNPLAVFTIQTATTWLNKAEVAITDFLQLGRNDRAAIAIFTLTRTR